MALPWFAIVILGAATLIAASVWILGARLRVARGEEALPSFRTMMFRGAFTPVALVFMAADFASSPGEWIAWIGLVAGSWLTTLVCVRGLLSVVFGAAPRGRMQPVLVETLAPVVAELEAEVASA